MLRLIFLERFCQEHIYSYSTCNFFSQGLLLELAQVELPTTYIQCRYFRLFCLHGDYTLFSLCNLSRLWNNGGPPEETVRALTDAIPARETPSLAEAGQNALRLRSKEHLQAESLKLSVFEPTDRRKLSQHQRQVLITPKIN